ncbi:Mpv17/PMP22 family protein [Aspergillus saccharolyticus JOP 1030-1]|uniref:Integral membrane protein, Mpv17/PMP22 family n=1 Tax=Aspergillus saccharolyticus JOP 1030-1 TaxID=1450539 RepID=A0A318ZL54_9EURO|nr:hypothetical protein BP01DRAFT_353486 [Aspergillus saccharolyticus JOP 1030-1]PYH48341.1 hypothetical protein BP01DRAFT_353486 [Aspergillus saccharolyticus JOP 1030-1]
MSATVFTRSTVPRSHQISRSLRSRRYQSSSKPSSSEPSKASRPPADAQTAASASGVPVVPASSTGQVGSRSLLQVIQAGPVGRVARAYSRVQERRPYATQLWSSVIIYLCGDLSAQLFFPEKPAPAPASPGEKEGKSAAASEEENEAAKGGYDPLRTLRHLTVGIGSSIPTFKWFMFLHNNFNYSSKFLSILTKVCVQQAVFTPVFNTYFFSLQSLLTGKSFEETFERLKLALPVSISNSVKLWPAVTAFSFMYVSPQFRSIFSGVIAVGWQTYLSWLNQKAAREVEAEMTETIEPVGISAGAAAIRA